MIDGKITEFIDQLCYGQELVFMYKRKKYFVQGWWNDDRTLATMVLEEVGEESFAGYLWEYQSDEMGKCAEAFLSSPIWNGKDFQQIEEEVTWGDW